MTYIYRKTEAKIRAALARGKSIMLLGPRQTGKTTVLSRINNDLSITFLIKKDRLLFEQNPDQLINIILELGTKIKDRLPVVILDEIQLVPDILNTVQYLIDSNKAQFILTGSSARKLRRNNQNINLLPGRVVRIKMDPLSIDEFENIPNLDELLLYGSLPGIITTTDIKNKELDLESYVITYLDEEIRQEAYVRNVGLFAKFLELFGTECGNIINYSKIANDLGVSHNSIKSYFEILEDCLIASSVEPITLSNSRKKLTKSPIYLCFDLGVRRLAAKQGITYSNENLGKLFEQFIGIELLKYTNQQTANLRFWRDLNGPEVDWVIEKEGKYLPIEVKYTQSPSLKDAKHVATFMQEYPCKKGLIVCRCDYNMQIKDNISAISWKDLIRYLDEIMADF